MKRALLIALAATLILASIAFAQPATWRQLDLERGHTFSVACPDAIVLLHVEPHSIIGHCGPGGTVPPDPSVFEYPYWHMQPESPLAAPAAPAWPEVYLPLVRGK